MSCHHSLIAQHCWGQPDMHRVVSCTEQPSNCDCVPISLFIVPSFPVPGRTFNFGVEGSVSFVSV